MKAAEEGVLAATAVKANCGTVVVCSFRRFGSGARGIREGERDRDAITDFERGRFQ